MMSTVEKELKAGGTDREELPAAGSSRPRSDDGHERGFRINNIAADAIAVRRSENARGDLQFDVEFAQQGKSLGRLSNLSLDDLETAVGEKNTRAAIEGKSEITLKGDQLAPYDGLTPKEQDRQIIEKETRKSADFSIDQRSARANEIPLTIPSAGDMEFDRKNPNAIENANPPKRQGQQIENEDILPHLREKAPRPVPPAIAEKYTQDGQRYYDRSSELKTPAFTDRGDKFSTARHDSQVASDMVEMARARGWEQIELKGDEEFRRAAWIAAEAKGIQTKGYTPTEKEIEVAANKRSTIEAVETTNITRDGELPADLRERAKTDPEALKAVGIRQLAKEVANHLLADRVLRERFERTVEHRLEEHLKGNRPLPSLKLRDDREKERGDDDLREQSVGR